MTNKNLRKIRLKKMIDKNLKLLKKIRLKKWSIKIWSF